MLAHHKGRAAAALLGAALLGLAASATPAAARVTLFRDAAPHASRASAHCGCVATRGARHARHHLARRTRTVVAGTRAGRVPYDWPPTENYEIVGYVDGPHLGANGTEGAEPGYGHCRWDRVPGSDGAPRWAKICGRAGYFTQTDR